MTAQVFELQSSCQIIYLQACFQRSVYLQSVVKLKTLSNCSCMLSLLHWSSHFAWI